MFRTLEVSDLLSSVTVCCLPHYGDCRNCANVFGYGPAHGRYWRFQISLGFYIGGYVSTTDFDFIIHKLNISKSKRGKFA